MRPSKLYFKESFNLKSIIIFVVVLVLSLAFWLGSYFYELKVKSGSQLKSVVDAFTVSGTFIITFYSFVLIITSGFFHPLNTNKKENKKNFITSKYKQKIMLEPNFEKKKTLEKEMENEISLLDKKYESKYITKANFLSYLGIIIGIVLLSISLIVYLIYLK
ncbi:hypothetical protein ACJA25_00275 [Mycoplasmopsis hyopharyngis]|uniref:hypothetical protein n=1 Tax=Mycoplasmopsis hyopharyngis TaxID=29558 RepID=UPI003872D957